MGVPYSHGGTMTTCPYCQTALDGIGNGSPRANEDAEIARYVLCPNCHNLVAGTNTR